MKLSPDEIDRAIDAYYAAHVKAGGELSRVGRRKDIERAAMRAALATVKDKK